MTETCGSPGMSAGVAYWQRVVGGTGERDSPMRSFDVVLDLSVEDTD